jgi:6-phosphogluconate dehydrogenase
MPGGSKKAWSLIEPIWLAISAKVHPDTGKPLEGATPGNPIEGGVPCSAYIGDDGAGHYVKMVHNGIEYGDMQMICEAYHLMTEIAKLHPTEIGKIFNSWNEGELDSFLIEITGDILTQNDHQTQVRISPVISIKNESSSPSFQLLKIFPISVGCNFAISVIK